MGESARGARRNAMPVKAAGRDGAPSYLRAQARAGRTVPWQALPQQGSGRAKARPSHTGGRSKTR